MQPRVLQRLHSPEGLACRLTLEVRDGQPLSFPGNEKVLHSTMARFSAALQAHVIIGGMGNVERAQRRSRSDTARRKEEPDLLRQDVFTARCCCSYYKRIAESRGT